MQGHECLAWTGLPLDWSMPIVRRCGQPSYTTLRNHESYRAPFMPSWPCHEALPLFHLPALLHPLCFPSCRPPSYLPLVVP